MNKMRNIKRQMEKDDALRLLKEGEYGVLSTVDTEGQTYGTPLSFVYKDEFIYFHCALEGTKLSNLKNNPRICFTVVGKTEILEEEFSTRYESVMAFGKAECIDGEEKKQALIYILEKYSSNFMEKGMLYINKAIDKTMVVKIKIDHLTGKHRA